MLEPEAVAVAVQLVAELVEEDVARDGERLAQRERPVRDAAGVLEGRRRRSVNEPGSKSGVSGVISPLSSAAVAVTSLKVEPVG